MTYMYTHTQIYTQCIFANIYIQTLLVQYSTGQGSTGQDTRGQGSSRVQYCTGHHLTLRYATLHDAALPDAMRRYATLILPRYIHPSMHRYIHTYISISINLNLNLNININITLHYTALIISHSLALHCIVFHYHYIDIPLYYNHYIVFHSYAHIYNTYQYPLFFHPGMIPTDSYFSCGASVGPLFVPCHCNFPKLSTFCDQFAAARVSERWICAA